MSTAAAPTTADDINYPDSDGKPMADNTKQFRWIVVLADNLQALFRDRQDVFVCGNQFWYPVEGENTICTAPDVYAVFGRPKGDRLSYKQWEEDNVPMTVVFEILSPSNNAWEMVDKQEFYEEHGVEEYYVYDPDINRLKGYFRRGDVLRRVRQMNGFVSPRLGIHFDLSGPELVVRYPDGRPFLTFEELEVERQRAVRLAEQEKQRAEQEKQRADQEKQRADQEKQRADRMAELTRKLLRQEATPEDLQELHRLSAPPPTDSGSATS
jgi:Uma2 family endonuclease